jgi:hypothetical protein
MYRVKKWIFSSKPLLAHQVVHYPPEVGKVTLKSNGDEASNDEFLLKRNGDIALNNVFL